MATIWTIGRAAQRSAAELGIGVADTVLGAVDTVTFGVALDGDYIGNPAYLLLWRWTVPRPEMFWGAHWTPLFQFSHRNAVRITVAGEYENHFIVASDIYACSSSPKAKKLYRTIRKIMSRECEQPKKDQFVGKNALNLAVEGTVRLVWHYRRPEEYDLDIGDSKRPVQKVDRAEMRPSDEE